METRQVRTREELLAAMALVHDQYVRCGYMPPHPSGFRAVVHNALPSTASYVALAGDELIATVSLFLDSQLG